MKKNIASLALLLLLAGAASAAVTNYFPNGKFDSPAGAAGAWIEVFGGGTTTYAYPTSGGNPNGFGVMTNTSGWGIWVGQTSPTAGYDIGPLGLVAGSNYNFVMDLKNFSGTGKGKLKIECWAGGAQLDGAEDIPAGAQSGSWVTRTFNRTLVPGTTSIMVVPVTGDGSVVGYDNIGVIVPSTPLAVAITSPLNGTQVLSNYTIEATATVSPGTVTNVAFYDGALLLGNDPSSPFSFSVNNATNGPHALKAIARDSSGNSATSSVVNITVSNLPPVVGWQLVWNDEFNGTSVDSAKWTFDIGKGVGGWGNNELQYYTSRPANVFVTNGFLSIIGRKEVPQYLLTNNYTSAKLKTQGLFSQKYGRFEFRARVPQGKGYWPALWMMPQGSVYGGWAASGEIDVMENKGRQTNVVSGAIHYGGSWPNNTYSSAEYTFPNGGVTTDFHVYVVEWSTNVIKWYVDGELFQTRTSWYSDNGPYPAPFDQPFYLIMNLAIGGNFDGNPDGTTVFPGTMQVDYARVYTNAPACVPPSAPAPGNNGPLWQGMTLNLTASTVPGATYQWSGPNGFNSTNQNPTLANVTTNNAGLFSVTASAGGCTSTPAATLVTINPPASVSIQPGADSIILNWPGGTLQSATNVIGPWDDVSGAISPRTNPAAAAQEFYRLKLP